jgi:Holliday junction resolvasome RuvABC endonuclease subunit
MIVLGIDPGLYGAFGVLSGGRYAKVLDMPITPILRGGKTRQDYDGQRIVRIFRHLKEIAEDKDVELRVAIEEIFHKPGDGGVGAMSYSKNWGRLIGQMEMADISFQTIAPNAWKPKMMGARKSKGDAVARAKQLWPKADLHLIKHHGRAEALLIAEYAVRFLGWGG